MSQAILCLRSCRARFAAITLSGEPLPALGRAGGAGPPANLAGMCVFPSQTNFLLLRISGAKRLQELLRAQGIAVRPAGSFPGLSNSYLRVAVRSAADNNRLVDAFTEALAG